MLMPFSRDCWIDVRDIAQAHVLALTKQDAGDNRILVTSTPSVWQDWSKCYLSAIVSYILNNEQSISLGNSIPTQEFLQGTILMTQPILYILSGTILPRPLAF